MWFAVKDKDKEGEGGKVPVRTVATCWKGGGGGGAMITGGVRG